MNMHIFCHREKDFLFEQKDRYFISKNEKVCILSRGYGGALSNKNVNVISDGVNLFHNAKEAGDEPYWLAVNLDGCAVITCKDS